MAAAEQERVDWSDVPRSVFSSVANLLRSSEASSRGASCSCPDFTGHLIDFAYERLAKRSDIDSFDAVLRISIGWYGLVFLPRRIAPTYDRSQFDPERSKLAGEVLRLREASRVFDLCSLPGTSEVDFDLGVWLLGEESDV